MSEREQQYFDNQMRVREVAALEAGAANTSEIARLRARLAAVEAEKREAVELCAQALDDLSIANEERTTLRAERDEAQRALEAALPWFEESDAPGATEMAETIRAALPVPARTDKTNG